MIFTPTPPVTPGYYWISPQTEHGRAYIALFDGKYWSFMQTEVMLTTEEMLEQDVEFSSQPIACKA